MEEKWKILVVDDEETLANFISKNLMLEREDYEVKVATNGRDAISLLEKFKPHLILQDIKLPDVNGIEVLKIAKALDPDIQVIMMTAYASLDTSVEALKAGAYDYLIKPFKIESLKNIVKNALSKRKLQEENKRLLKELQEVNRELSIANEKLKSSKIEVDKKLEKKVEILSTMHKWSDRILSELSLLNLLPLILDSILEITKKEDGAVLFREKDNLFEVKKVKGFANMLKEGTKMEIPTYKEPEIIKYEEGEIKEVIIIPLETKEGVLGMLFVGNRENSSMDEYRDELSIFGNYVAVSIQNAMLFARLERSYIESLLALVKATEAKDPSLKGHSQRVSELAVKLAQKLSLSEEEIKNIRYAALLHDVGKIGIKEYILEKPDALSREEMEVMKEHIKIGEEILKPIAFLRDVIPLIRYHHENYDGTGYPEGLKGEEIPLGAQIISICDVYDAISQERTYSEGKTLEETLEMIRNLSGKKFSPFIVKKFIEMIEEEKK